MIHIRYKFIFSILFTLFVAAGCLNQGVGTGPVTNSVKGNGPGALGPPKGDAEGVAGIIKPGTLDSLFNFTGIVTTSFQGQPSFGHGMSIQRDAKLVLTGWTYKPGANPPADFAVARYHADGSLDTGFGNGGKLTTAIPDFYSANAVGSVIQDSGKILVVGSGYPFAAGGARSIILARYNSNGILDTTYGNAGFLTTNLMGPSGAYDTIATNVTSQGDGKILVSGGAYRGGNTWDFVLVRYNANGTPDQSFGDQGISTTNVGLNNITGNGYCSGARALAVQNDGKVVVVGYSAPAYQVGFQIAAVRYHANGSLDTSFGQNGVVVTPISPYASGANAVAIQSDGRIVVAGTDDRSMGEYDFALVRYHANGSIDNTLGPEGGVIRTSIGKADRASGVAIQKDGKIVSAGYTYSPADQSIAMSVVRHRTDGTLDPDFGDNGKASAPMGTVPQSPGTNGSGVTIQADGKIVTGGYSFHNGTPDFAIARFNP